VAYALDQRLDVGGRRTPGVQNEVRVLLRDHGAADALALHAGLLDEPARVVAGRIAEHRAAARRAHGLHLAALREQRANRGRRRVGVALEAERRGDEPLGGRRADDRAVADLELRARARALDAVAVDGAAAFDVVPRPAAESAGVHRARAADAARDAGEEHGRPELPRETLPREQHARHARADAHAEVVELLDLLRQRAGRDDRA